MAENLAPQLWPIIEMPPEHESSSTISESEYNRQQFDLSLLKKGLISQKFYDSGKMNAFAVDENTGIYRLKHMLEGDETGGLHHLPTVIALGTEGRTVGSKIYNPANPTKKRRDYRSEQKERENGVFQAYTVEVTSDDGEVYAKDHGSFMFPNEWSTQQVIESVIAATGENGVWEYDPQRDTTIHKAMINGVPVCAVTEGRPTVTGPDSVIPGSIIGGWPLKKL